MAAPYTLEQIENFHQVQIRIAKDMSNHGGSIAGIAKELKVTEDYVKQLLSTKGRTNEE